MFAIRSATKLEPRLRYFLGRSKQVSNFSSYNSLLFKFKFYHRQIKLPHNTHGAKCIIHLDKNTRANSKLVK